MRVDDRSRTPPFQNLARRLPRALRSGRLLVPLAVLAGCIVTCPWHGFQFDVGDGRHQTSKQLHQETFGVKTEDGGVFVDLPA